MSARLKITAKALLLPLFLAVVGIVSFAGMSLAHAAVTGAPPDDSTPLLALLRPIYDAFHAGHSVAAGALALIAAVALLRRYADKIPGVGPAVSAFLHTDLGGALSTFVLAAAGAVAAADSVSVATLKLAGGLGIGAIGGYTALRKLVVDRIMASKWYAGAPSWAKALLSVLTFLGSKPGDTAKAEASKAGDASVAANPAPGAAGVVGEPEKF